MQKIKPYILPVALVLGLLLHSQAVVLAPSVPYIIFSILLLNFTAVDLRSLSFCRLDAWIMAFQALVSVGGYVALRLCGCSEVLAQGLLIGVLCPVASSVVVVASALGADRRITTGYTIFGNLLVALLAPLCFSFIGVRQDMPLVESYLLIFGKIASVIALPYVVALVLQFALPKVSHAIGSLREWALVLWAMALFLTLGQTIDYIFRYHSGNGATIAWLAVIALAVCVLQFGVGRRLGRRIGQPVAGAQLTGQKNTAIGIWMASIYLMPLSSVVLAFYSIFQNLFNSWQLYRVRNGVGTPDE